MIEIDGLTKYQKDMLNYMWDEIDSVDEFESWLDTLAEDERLMALTLSKLIMFAVIDESANRLEYYPEAETVLEKYYI
jgi:hypothetical protein